MISVRSPLLVILLALNGLFIHGSNATAGSCERTSQFKAAVVAVHEVTDAASIGETELEAMGHAFAKALDHMNDDEFGWSFCDGSLARHAKNVRVEAKEKYFIGRQKFVYHIDGDCNKDCRDYHLFHHGSPPTEEGTSSASCGCPADKTDRGATEEEFLRQFKRVINRMTSKGHLKHITAVTEIMEAVPFACSDQELEFTEEVVLSLSSDVSPADEQAVGEGYMDAFNLAANHYCDNEGSHRLTSAILMPQSSVRFGGRRLGKRLLKSDGRTRKKKESGSTNDGTRRKLQLTYHETCYCPSNPRANQSPSDQDVAALYNKVLEYERSRGSLRSHYRIQGLKRGGRKRKTKKRHGGRRRL